MSKTETITAKSGRYRELIGQIKTVLEGEENLISILSTIPAICKQELEYIYWIGFYLEERGILKIGPYQGTLGCLTISPDRGVCGRAFRTAQTQLVDDVHADPEHIACDAASKSEIVIPIRRSDGTVFGVLDVDSDKLSAFDQVDRQYLERIISECIEPLI